MHRLLRLITINYHDWIKLSVETFNEEIDHRTEEIGVLVFKNDLFYPTTNTSSSFSAMVEKST